MAPKKYYFTLDGDEADEKLAGEGYFVTFSVRPEQGLLSIRPPPRRHPALSTW